ncbi:hypothetical protein [Arenibacter sp. ARW7G5Y1]|uniref:hypothetical protein n=1 Tax=Arenibacter sp. ARW7G5Y1 TaxID=2135619 RepID=UPI000D774D33|nr:hypothetical protein [Arenibacter sp. ARW7G5Y1]PXX30400.1 hypothetical protein C7972_10223 [Arenibacter sp. ARW7G5Y1]
MLKISLVITKVSGEKYPVILLFNSHHKLYVTTIIGEEATPLETLADKTIEEHITSVQNFLGTLGTYSDFNVIPNDNLTSDFIERLRNM